MNCIKCGRELKAHLVFCEECQEGMKHYPVRPGTLVQLPSRPTVHETKKKHSRAKKSLSQEEQLSRLRAAIRLLVTALVVTLLAFVLTVFMMLHLLDERDARNQIGQNYSAFQADDG